jgi:hypothetical protein
MSKPGVPFHGVLGVIVVIASSTVAAQLTNQGNRPPTEALPPAPLASFASRAPAGDTNANPTAVSQPAGTNGVPTIEALAELNTLAKDLNAVFVFLPGKDGRLGDSPFKAIHEAKQSLEKRFEIKIGVFAFKPGSPDYDGIAAQMSVPGVLAIVKTGVRSCISGDLTEKKIVDGFLAAVASGGCCPLGEPSGSPQGGVNRASTGKIKKP